MKWIGQNIYDQVSKFRNTVDFSDTVNFSEDVTFYQPVNNADPQISIGSSDAERLQIFASYTGTGSQTMQQAMFVTHTASGTAHDGMFTFAVDGAVILDFKDAGINLRTGMGIGINGTDILTDSSGTATLSNIDALDATTISTFNAALTAGDITGVTAGTGMTGGGTEGALTLNVIGGTGITANANDIALTNGLIADGSNITSLGTLTALTVDNIGINGDTITASGDLAIVATGNDISVDTDNFVITSATDQRPFLELKNTTNSTKGSKLQFTKDKGAAGADGDIIGLIDFMGDDAAQTQTLFARIQAQVSEADDSDEAGKLTLSVAASDGTTTSIKQGLLLEGEHATSGEVDVTIANGAASTTTIAGTLTMGSTATINNSGVVQVAAQTVIDHDQLANFTADEHFTQANITTVGTIDTGVWNGTAIATDQQKHLATFDIRGYSTADGTNYEIPVFVTDNNAPFEHNTSAGSDGLTALAVTKLIRATGVVMPYAGTLKKWKGWATHSTTSGTCNIALFRYRPVAGNGSTVSLVLLDAVGHTPAGNSKVIDIEQTTFTDADVAEGDIIISGIKGDGSQITYFVSTLEIEWD